MMTNLFSMFDPSTKIFNLSLNWISMLIIILILPKIYWLIPNNWILMLKKILKLIFNESKLNMKKKDNHFSLMLNTLFIFILINNFLGLFPYIFTSTSHLIINFSMTLPMWMMAMLFGWINMTNKMFTHLVPRGTPNNLIMFMILIESISILIRPITLTIRLTANMIAGHLLLTLLGNLGSKLIIILTPALFFIQMILFMLESAVAIIQSYVFMVLMTLYVSEI